jgi:hypothetical protein
MLQYVQTYPIEVYSDNKFVCATLLQTINFKQHYPQHLFTSNMDLLAIKHFLNRDRHTHTYTHTHTEGDD